MSLVHRIRRVVAVVAPEGTRRRKAVRVPVRVARSVRKNGLKATARAALGRVRRVFYPENLERTHRWYADNTPPPALLAQQRARIWPRSARPTVALILPVTAAPDAAFCHTLASLAAQTYPHWEVDLVGNERHITAARQALLAAGVDQCRLVPASAGTRPDQYLSLALTAAKADFVGVLGGGDTLSPHALFEFADLLAARPEYDVVYCDEDCIAPRTGKRHGLVLKPDWSPEMMLGHNYCGKLALARRTELLAAGGFDPAYGPAQEYDALLRLSERSAAITRVPKCLYHRRAEFAKQPVFAASPEEAHLLAEAARAHLSRRGLAATAAPQANGTHRVTWPVTGSPLVSVIIPTLNNLAVLKVCLDGLIDKTTYPNKEILLVDNNSTDPAVLRYYAELERAGTAKVVPYHKEFNYSEACNTGAREARGEVLLFLNNDIEVIDPDWLTEMVRFCLLPGVGCVGTKLLYPDGIVQHAGVVLGMHMCGLFYNRVEDGHWDMFGSPDLYRDLAAIMGACQMMPRKVFDVVGGFDERYRIANSDVAICVRALKAGYRTVYTPYAALFHHEGYTRGKVNPIADLEMTARDLVELGFDEDPYFHPELHPDHAHPRLRLAGEATPRQSLAAHVAHFAPRRQRALDVHSDQAIRASLGHHGPRFSFPHWTGDDVGECEWAAARFVLQVIRSSPHLRKRFPHALSEGPDGGFCRWLCTEGVVRFDLPASAAKQIRKAFKVNPGARIRQVLDFRPDLRQIMPTAALPSGRRPFLEWLVCHGKPEAGLRDEQIWWWLVETTENPLREFVGCYLMSPEWQSYFPDALTVGGWPGFYRWVSAKHGLLADGLDLAAFVPPYGPVEQLRLAYEARPRWRLRFPDALNDPQATRRLVDWVRRGGWEQGSHGDDFGQELSADLVKRSDPLAGVNVLGHFRYPSGLQASVVSVVESLRRKGYPVAVRDVPVMSTTDEPDRRDYLGQELYGTTVIHVQPEPLFSTAFDRAGLYPARSRHRIGMWYWEFGEVPPQWADLGADLQELWAPTRFIADALKTVMMQPVYPMLPGVELEEVADVPRSRFGLADDDYLFLFMYDMRSIQERKNPLGLIRAFRSAFKRHDKATLVVKVSRGTYDPEEFAKLNAAADSAGAVVINETLTREDSYGLIKACDCYVSLHRSEGLGLTMAESMLLGKPTIATAYSGNVDFMTPADSMLVGYKLVPLEREIHPYKRGYLWAEPSVPEAAHWMRWAYDHAEEARALGVKGKEAAERVLSMEAAGDRLVRRLTEIDQSRRQAGLKRKAA